MVNPSGVKYYCGARVFFTAMRHPGAANCECPKYDDGSCVPRSEEEEYFAKLYKEK